MRREAATGNYMNFPPTPSNDYMDMNTPQNIPSNQVFIVLQWVPDFQLLAVNVMTFDTLLQMVSAHLTEKESHKFFFGITSRFLVT